MAAVRIMAMGLTMGGSSFSYFGAEPCVGSNTATSSPTLPEHANPRPPTRPAKASDAMSPNMLPATITPYSSGFFVSHIICASMFVDHSWMSG
jgi:hypothetical protein